MNAPSIPIVALSTCPVAGLVWRRPGAAWTLTVICRATFVLRPGRAILAPRQHLPVAGDHGYPDGSPGLYAPSDLVPQKPRVDVLLVGPAHTADRMARSVAARLTVGEIDKRVEVAPGASAGLGPARSAPERDWQGRTVDVDPACFNAAPAGQQLASLRGDERLTLTNLHPEHPDLVTHLPGLVPLALVEGPGLQARRLALRADTLWIDSSTGVGALVFRGQLSLDRGLPRAVLVDVAHASSARHLQSTVGVSSTAVSQAALPFLQQARPAAPPPPAVVTPPALVPLTAPPALAQAAPPPPDASEQSPWVSGMIAARPPVPLTHTPIQPVRQVAPEPEPDVPRGPPDTLQLIWFDPQSVPRALRDPRFRAILESMDEGPPDREDMLEGDVADREDRRDLLEILTRGKPQDVAAVACALDQGVTDDGRLVQPIVLVAGDLRFVFDERKRLEAMLSAAAPHAGVGAVKTELATARAFLAAPGVGHGAGVCAVLCERLRAALLTIPEDRRGADLDAEVERGLLDTRAFQKRRVLGAVHVRALLASTGAGAGDTRPAVYLREALASKLPRAAWVGVRLLAAVHAGLDEREAVALWPVAAAVVTAARAGG